MQAIGFVAGILVVRLLPVNEYAFYTLANSMLGAMALLAGGGISAGVMAEGGKVWQDRKKLSSVLATGFDLRRKFAAFSLLVAVPILFYLLRTNGASWTTCTMIILALMPTFFATVSGKLLEIPLQLHQHIGLLQRYQIESNAGRLLLLALTMFTFPFSVVAIACAGATQTWNNYRLRGWYESHMVANEPIDPEVRSRILCMIKRILPDAVFYCISGQITIWILAVAGSTTGVAQLGALGRLAVPLTIVGAVFSTLFIPRFSRHQSDAKSLAWKFMQSQVATMLSLVLIILGAFIFARPILWTLGPAYANLTYEMVLVLAAGALSVLHGAAFGTCLARGLVMSPLLNVGGAILVQAALLLFIGVASLRQVLYFSLAFSVFQYLRWSWFFIRHFGWVRGQNGGA